MIVIRGAPDDVEDRHIVAVVQGVDPGAPGLADAREDRCRIGHGARHDLAGRLVGRVLPTAARQSSINRSRSNMAISFLRLTKPPGPFQVPIPSPGFSHFEAEARYPVRVGSPLPTVPELSNQSAGESRDAVGFVRSEKLSVGGSATAVAAASPPWIRTWKVCGAVCFPAPSVTTNKKTVAAGSRSAALGILEMTVVDIGLRERAYRLAADDQRAVRRGNH